MGIEEDIEEIKNGIQTYKFSRIEVATSGDDKFTLVLTEINKKGQDPMGKSIKTVYSRDAGYDIWRMLVNEDCIYERYLSISQSNLGEATLTDKDQEILGRLTRNIVTTNKNIVIYLVRARDNTYIYRLLEIKSGSGLIKKIN